MNNIINSIKSRYTYLVQKNEIGEENIKVKLTWDVFLRECGYDLLECSYEKPCRDKYADIIVKVNGSDYLFIETKKADYNFSSKDIIQLAQYISPYGMKWGILTNGKDYILINTDIDVIKSLSDGALINQVVFWFNVFDNKSKNYTRHEYFKYLTKQNMFDKQVASFFKDIAQFKAIKFSEKSRSWENYKSTLFSFFEYYSDEKNKYTLTSLEQITVDDFLNYINMKNNKNVTKSITSQNAIYNNYSHLSSMLNTLVENNKIRRTNFDKGRQTQLANMIFERTNKNINYLDSCVIEKVIEFYRVKDIKKLTIFLLCATIGLERKQIYNLQWTDIDLKKGCIIIKGRIIPLNKILINCFNQLSIEKDSKKIREKHVFVTNYSGGYKRAAENYANEVCNKLCEIDENDEKWKLFSPEYLRTCLIKVMFESGFTIEEIIYVTGIDIKNIYKYISTDKIIEKQSLKYKSITYNRLFNGVLEK